MNTANIVNGRHASLPFLYPTVIVEGVIGLLSIKVLFNA